MKGLIIPALVILTTGIIVEIAYADSGRDVTAGEHHKVVQLFK